MGIDPSTMVALIDELERAGLAKRRPHPKDRRAREVVITPKGRRTVEQGRALAREVEDDVLQGLGSTERRKLLGCFGRRSHQRRPSRSGAPTRGTSPRQPPRGPVSRLP